MNLVYSIVLFLLVDISPLFSTLLNQKLYQEELLNAHQKGIIGSVDAGIVHKHSFLKLPEAILFDFQGFFLFVIFSTWLRYSWNLGVFKLPGCITNLSGECRELLIYALDYQWSRDG
ncbi:hypothetical protein ACT7C1_15685 [Bacillus paranthracis]